MGAHQLLDVTLVMTPDKRRPDDDPLVARKRETGRQAVAREQVHLVTALLQDPANTAGNKRSLPVGTAVHNEDVS